jgi:glycosyltransferase involved in cell wall biosynthesis
MSQTPFISVVIPTRNRGHLVVNAIKSLLWQDFDDFELIVSDNCSADDTAQAVRETGGERVRYVRPDRVLSMPDHWEFALDHARGQFITYLCDDDVWVPGGLSRIADTLTESRAELVVSYSGLYHAPNWLDVNQQNSLVLARFSNNVLEFESEATIQKIYSECRVTHVLPRMLNSFCKRETLQRVRNEAGRVFLLCPDYSFAAMILTAIPKWLYVDEPLHLQGVFPEGIGSSQSFNRGEPAEEFTREFKEDKPLKYVPLKSMLVSNLISDTLLLSREQLPALAGYQLNWVNYFLSCWNDILTLEGNGVNTAADKAEFERVLSSQPIDVQESVNRERIAIQQAAAGAGRSGVRAVARTLINSSSLLTNLESRVRRKPAEANGNGRYRTIAGGEAGFANILECARAVPGLVGSSRD